MQVLTGLSVETFLAVLAGGVLLGMIPALAAAAWWLKRTLRLAEGAANLDQDTADQLISGLRSVTDNVAADVEQHLARMNSNRDELRDLTESMDQPSGRVVMGVVAQIIRSNEGLYRQLVESESRLASQAAEIRAYADEARTDALTGLPNRRAFDDEIARGLAERTRTGRPFSLLLIDIDRFKQVNDQYGHQQGDAILKRVAEVMRDVSRDMDLVARYGGEEFAAILPGTSSVDAVSAAERQRTAIAETQGWSSEKDLQVTVSIGVAEATADESTAALLRRADSALYTAKQEGRNCTRLNDGQRSVSADRVLQGGLDAGQGPASPTEAIYDDVRQRLAELSQLEQA